ncbi:TPA: ferrochelatase [Pasteurella multocida]|uniref:ferrochelatase n=1 Tax=Pasteurella multocida TaxID=747 RepID=UPI0028DFE6B7|nr:ferrochelatase [Pasteurella multocida]MDY0500265.1 ferrochelatase [Pasteurella multocida]MDY0655448.1 ferrochelatase [Pasteurella multocida]WRU40610.1 ferrochelatase [Pasteurella multocida]HDR1920423.1 ferrochelatase [Pasteurella multocida]HEA3245239.1 ferrochelatase [Pasteurella multocida]
MNKAKTGVLLVNLGTPESPTPKAISRYLWQFLTDPRVVDLPRYKWFPLLKGIILPLRAKRVAKNYASIWTEQGSPLLTITREQQHALQTYFKQQEKNIVVEVAMTYGEPSIKSAMQRLSTQQVDNLIVFPLYPQYSSSTTGAVFDAFAQVLKTQRGVLPFDFIHSYHTNEDYIAALVTTIQEHFQPDEFLLFSFHGIPVRYENMGDYYREHCKQTVLAVIDRLGLTENQWGLSFQSRFGKEEWLQPYTDQFLAQAPSQNIQKMAVICPGFAADCLETLEEIKEENKEIFLANGGISYRYIPALNARQEHIQMMANLILNKLNQTSK